MRGGKRGGGWYEMERRYRHNRIPEPPVVTQWQRLLSAIHMGEEDALMAVRKPGSMAAATLRQGLRENGMYRTHFVPEPVLRAFGWQEEVEARIAGEWANARVQSKPKEKQADLPLLEKVRP